MQRISLERKRQKVENQQQIEARSKLQRGRLPLPSKVLWSLRRRLGTFGIVVPSTLV